MTTPAPTQATRGAVTEILEALGELGGQVLPLPLVIQIHRLTKAFSKIDQETKELHNAIMAPRIPEGATQLTPKDPGYADAVQQLEELKRSHVNLPAVTPIPALPHSVAISASRYGMLVAIGLLSEPPQDVMP